MRFDELVLKVPDDEIRLKFHPRMTVLSGLGPSDRQALASTIIGALTGGPEPTALRCVDGAGRTLVVLNGGGQVKARLEDGGAPASLGDLMTSPDALRDLIVVAGAEVGATTQADRPDDPPELTEARASLAEIDEELKTALDAERRAAELQAEVDAIDERVRLAEENAARREYAELLAELEDLRLEAAAQEAGPAEAEADQNLLQRAHDVQALATRWSDALERWAVAVEQFGGAERLHGDELAQAAALPESVPGDLASLVDAMTDAEERCEQLERRLGSLTLGKLPTPTDPLVADLGLLDQPTLWSAAQRVTEAAEERRRVYMLVGGLGGEDDGQSPIVIEELETAHRAVQEAEQAAEAVRIVGVAGTGFGLAVTLAGAIGAPMLIPLGMLIAVVVGVVGLVLPRRRAAAAQQLEREALARTGAASYLGFHLRRVDASMDPNLRGTLEAAVTEQVSAAAAWAELTGPDVDVDRARALEEEIRSYNGVLSKLAGATAEVDQLRADLAERAHPAAAAARAALVAACGSLGVAASDLQDAAAITTLAHREVHRGRAARRQIALDEAEAQERRAAKLLEGELDSLGIAPAVLEDRVRAFQGAAEEARVREDARAAARPREEIDLDIEAVEEEARALYQPEWSDVTSAEADGPDVEALEARRAELHRDLAAVAPSAGALRLADRRAALERRVAALEAQLDEQAGAGDSSSTAEIQQYLLERLDRSAKAGPHQDALPALLDEVLERVPADRRWDLLDFLYQESERQQIVVLTEDPFVAAWARQRAQGSISLLEPEPEPV